MNRVYILYINYQHNNYVILSSGISSAAADNRYRHCRGRVFIYLSYRQ